MRGLSRAPIDRVPFERLYDVLPVGSSLREALIAQATYAATGPQYAVNSPDPDGQSGVASAELVDGRAIVVWTDYSDLPEGSTTGFLYGRLLDSSGLPIGPELKLTSSSQVVSFYSFEVGALADGGFVLVWTENDAAGGTFANVFAQTFAADATPTSEAFQVNIRSANNQWFPAVTGLEGGGFVVTWIDFTQPAGVKGRLYSAAGEALGGEIQVNTMPGTSFLYPAVDALEGGGFVVSWTNAFSGRASSVDVRLQAFDATGNKVAGEINVNGTARLNDQHSDVIGTEDGGFLVVWRQLNLDTGVQSILGQKFDSPVDTSGSQFVVTSSIGVLDLTPSVAELDDGFVVVFESGEPGFEDVNARVYREWDEPWTDTFLVPTKNEFRQFDAEVIPLGNGFLVSWNDSLDSFALKGDIDVRVYTLDWA